MTEAESPHLAAVFAGLTRPAPMRFAIRVEEAMDRVKGSWNVKTLRVPRTDCAANAVVPKKDEAKVRISKARNSASIMTRLGMASRIMGIQLWRARRVKPGQH